MCFVNCPKQGPIMESIVLNRVGILGLFFFFCPKQGQGLKPSTAPLHTNMRQVPRHPRGGIKPKNVTSARSKELFLPHFPLDSTVVCAAKSRSGWPEAACTQRTLFCKRVKRSSEIYVKLWKASTLMISKQNHWQG